MNIKRINWPSWTGFLLSIFAFLSYFIIFVQFPITRDFPWLNLLLFVAAVVLLVFGLRRAFAKDRPLRSKIFASVATAIGLLSFVLFAFTFFIGGTSLPASGNAPQVGQKAPDFTLRDTNDRTVSLAELLSSPLNGKAPRGVLLIFYRGYW